MHPRHVAEADEEPHPRPVAAAEIDARGAGGDAGLLGQVHRRAEAADVDLLAHDQFPQIALRPAVDRLNVAQADVSMTFHGNAPDRESCPQQVVIPARRASGYWSA